MAARWLPLLAPLLAGATCFVAPPPPAAARKETMDETLARLRLQGGYLDWLERGGEAGAGRVSPDDETGSEAIGGGDGDPYAPGVAEAYGLSGSSGEGR